MSHVKLDHVTKRYGAVVAVGNLNLEIEKGECFSLLGPSGCGKTTTLRMIAGFEDLDEGQISVGGKVFSSSFKKYYLPPEKRDFGMVFQAFAVWPHLNVFDNVAFPLQIKGLPKAEIAERTRRAIHYTGLDKVETTYPGALSGGQKQRIALARAIAINPTVMLLDEPLSNLDPKLREEMRFEIKDLQRRFGFTILYVTHDQAEAMALSDRILVMANGVAQQVDTPLNIYTKPINQFVFSFIGLSNFLPAVVSDGSAFIEGAIEAGPVTSGIAGTAPRQQADARHAPLRDRLRERRRCEGDGEAHHLPGRHDRLPGDGGRNGSAHPEKPDGGDPERGPALPLGLQPDPLV